MKDLILLSNVGSIMTLNSAHKKNGKNLKSSDLSIEKNTSMICSRDEILYVGSNETDINRFKNRIFQNIDLSEYSVVPEIVDSHTHLVFGGNRSDEYTMRLNGATYEEIANNGGGINHTSTYTNLQNSEQLFNESVKKIEKIISYGVGTIEIKSGYGLNIAKEIELSKIIDRLKKYFAPKTQIINTFMAAHAIPKEFSDSEQYLNEVCIPSLKELAKINILDFVDIFHEKGYFNERDVRRLYLECTKLNLKMRVHADEFCDNNGAKIAAELNFSSADHLLAISDSGIKALAESNTVATLLPGTGYFLGKKQAPARKLLDAGCKVAIASDYNPGSCHIDNLILIANLAAPNYKMNQAELWASITLNAAHSLGLDNQGAIIKGLRPRFTFFKTKNLNEITYSWTTNFVTRIEAVDQFFF